MHDKEEYVIQISNLKQGLNHILVLKKVPRIIKFNPKNLLKSYNHMNTELCVHVIVKFNQSFLNGKCKKWFWKRFFQAKEQCKF